MNLLDSQQQQPVHSGGLAPCLYTWVKDRSSTFNLAKQSAASVTDCPTVVFNEGAKVGREARGC